MPTISRRRPPAIYGTSVPGRPKGTFVNSTISDRGFTYRWIDTTQIPPVLEQPRLIFNSAAQPFVRWGFRRIIRTRMTTSARFLGRFFYAGGLMNRALDRERMAGVQARGFTYQLPQVPTAPTQRTVVLGQTRKRTPAIGR